RLLGEQAGHWSVRAAGATEVSRRYLDRTMVLETTFRTPTGSLVVVDALAGGGQPGSRTRYRRASPPAAPGHLHGRRGRGGVRICPPPRVRAHLSLARHDPRRGNRDRRRRHPGPVLPWTCSRRRVVGLGPAAALGGGVNQLRPPSL